MMDIRIAITAIGIIVILLSLYLHVSGERSEEFIEIPEAHVVASFSIGDITPTHCIALGYKAGYDWTSEQRMFAFTCPNGDGTYTEYSTQMTEDEYLNVYNVVQRAIQHKRIINE